MNQKRDDGQDQQANEILDIRFDIRFDIQKESLQTAQKLRLGN